MKRSMFALAAALVLTAGSAYAQTNVTGDWDVTIETGQGANTVRVTFKQDGDKLSGLFKSQMGEMPFEGGSVAGNDLKFGFAISIQGQSLDITMTGKVVGESIEGKAQFGGFGEGDWKGVKVAATAAAATPAPAGSATAGGAATGGVGLSGKWDVMLKTGMGDVPATANLTETAGKISGTFVGPTGEIPVDGTFDGNALKLSFTAKTPQGDIPVSMTGELSGDALAGKADFGGMGAGEWSAKRIKQ
jgi:hypothetical protein